MKHRQLRQTLASMLNRDAADTVIAVPALVDVKTRNLGRARELQACTHLYDRRRGPIHPCLTGARIPGFRAWPTPQRVPHAPCVRIVLVTAARLRPCVRPGRGDRRRKRQNAETNASRDFGCSFGGSMERAATTHPPIENRCSVSVEKKSNAIPDFFGCRSPGV